MNKPPTVLEQLRAINQAAEARITRELADDALDLEVEPALLEYRRQATPALYAVRKKLANRNEVDLLDAQDDEAWFGVWIRFWQQYSAQLATSAIDAALGRRARARDAATYAMKQWHDTELNQMRRLQRQAAITAVQSGERGVFKQVREYVNEAGHRVKEMVAPDLYKASLGDEFKKGDAGWSDT
jgi:hypothetical protein